MPETRLQTTARMRADIQRNPSLSEWEQHERVVRALLHDATLAAEYEATLAERDQGIDLLADVQTQVHNLRLRVVDLEARLAATGEKEG